MNYLELPHLPVHLHYLQLYFFFTIQLCHHIYKNLIHIENLSDFRHPVGLGWQELAFTGIHWATLTHREGGGSNISCNCCFDVVWLHKMYVQFLGKPHHHAPRSQSPHKHHGLSAIITTLIVVICGFSNAVRSLSYGTDNAI